MGLKVKLRDMDEIARFSIKCSEFEEDIDFRGNNRYVIDGKSVLGVLSIASFDDEGTVEIHTEDETVIEKFKEALKQWVIE